MGRSIDWLVDCDGWLVGWLVGCVVNGVLLGRSTHTCGKCSCDVHYLKCQRSYWYSLNISVHHQFTELCKETQEWHSELNNANNKQSTTNVNSNNNANHSNSRRPQCDVCCYCRRRCRCCCCCSHSSIMPRHCHCSPNWATPHYRPTKSDWLINKLVRAIKGNFKKVNKFRSEIVHKWTGKETRRKWSTKK